MTEESRPPVAIRSLRPYDTEDAFLAEERDTLSRTAITLIGAPSRPRGVVIRFELTLRDGTALIRGEGRVLGFEPADERGPSSLTLRFTRLDARSKLLVDRAAALREARDRGDEVESTVAMAGGGPTSDEDPLAMTQVGEVAREGSEPPPSEEVIALSTSSAVLVSGDVEEIGARTTIDTRASLAAATEVPPPLHSDEVPAKMSALSSDPARRDGLLDRLRSRAKALSPSQIATILAVPRTSSS